MNISAHDFSEMDKVLEMTTFFDQEPYMSITFPCTHILSVLVLDTFCCTCWLGVHMMSSFATAAPP